MKNKVYTKSVSVFCGAQSPETYLDLAYNVGRKLAVNGFVTVTGGGSGMMAQVNKGAKEAGGKSRGIAIYKDTVVARPYCDQYEIHDDLIPRQQALINAGDAFVALPGGIGTVFEVLEMSLKKRFGQVTYETPVILLGHYFDDLLITLEKMRAEGFIRDSIRSLFVFVEDEDEMVEVLHRRLGTHTLKAYEWQQDMPTVTAP